MAPTSTCRTSVGVAVLGGYLYAVGGQDGVSCLNIVERYSFFLKSREERARCYLTTYFQKEMEPLSELFIEMLLVPFRYDPKENKWTRVASMSTRRLGVAVAVLGGFLYAVGGSDGTSPLNTGISSIGAISFYESAVTWLSAGLY